MLFIFVINLINTMNYYELFTSYEYVVNLSYYEPIDTIHSMYTYTMYVYEHNRAITMHHH